MKRLSVSFVGRKVSWQNAWRLNPKKRIEGGCSIRLIKVLFSLMLLSLLEIDCVIESILKQCLHWVLSDYVSNDLKDMTHLNLPLISIILVQFCVNNNLISLSLSFQSLFQRLFCLILLCFPWLGSEVSFSVYFIVVSRGKSLLQQIFCRSFS